MAGKAGKWGPTQRPGGGVLADKFAGPLPNAVSAYMQKQEIQKETRRLADELDKIKIATMRNMVDKINLDVQESHVDINALYLTNAQAQNVSTSMMPEVRSQLGIENPKMVIRLMPSHFGKVFNRTFPWFTAGSDGGRFPTKRIPEMSDVDQESAEHQLILLVKDVLLPLASRTGSLVIGSESCALTAAFVQVSAPLQRQLGKACPFRLVIIARAYYFHVKSHQEGTVSYQVRRQCKGWLKVDFEAALNSQFGQDKAYWPLEDLPTGQYSLIAFECLSEGGQRPAHEICNNFSNDFMASLSEELPVIALQTYGTNKMNMVPALAEHVSRGLPLMLLDSRRRPPASSLDEASQQLADFSKDLHETRGRVDQYYTSALAYVKATLERGTDSGTGSSGSQDKGMWIWQAIVQRLKDRMKEASQSGQDGSRIGPLPSSGQHTVAIDMAMQATNVIMGYVGQELEWESLALQDRCRSSIVKVMEASSWEEFARQLEENWTGIRGCCFHSFDRADAFAKDKRWIRLDELKKPTRLGTKVLRIDPAIGEQECSLEEAKETLGELLWHALKVSCEYDSKSKSRASFVSNQDMWLAVYDILKEPHIVHTGNLHDLETLSGKLFNLAQIDRLPATNTLEGLILIRAAWTVIDVFNDSAQVYKLYTKITYTLLLILGVVTVAFTVLSAVYGPVSEDQQRIVLLVLALSGSCLTGYTALVDPARKWMQLRNGAYSLEAEVWKFRTRVGEYAPIATSSSHHARVLDERRAESLLQQVILQVQGRVRLSAGLKETSFYALAMTTNDLQKPERTDPSDRPTLTESSWALYTGGDAASMPGGHGLTKAHYRHRQYKRTGEDPLKGPADGEDSFHAAAKPEDYIRWRLVPKLRFYQNRIPRYAYKRRAFQAIVLLSSLTTSLLAAIGDTNWTAIIASITSAVAGWQEFVDVARKLQRYSTVAAALGNLMVWWQSLTEVDKASLKNVTFLVDHTESLLTEERNAWITDAQMNVRLGGTTQELKDQKRVDVGNRDF